jgi:osmotically-inducible protein OsmY
VLLAGQAPTEELRQRIVEITKKIPNVKRIYNEIALQAPSSALTTASDAWITAKVKTALLGAKGLHSGQFKIVTENGTVFLMGVVERKQADLAVEATRKVDGVQKVVKIFEYK